MKTEGVISIAALSFAIGLILMIFITMAIEKGTSTTLEKIIEIQRQEHNDQIQECREELQEAETITTQAETKALEKDPDQLIIELERILRNAPKNQETPTKTEEESTP